MKQTNNFTPVITALLLFIALCGISTFELSVNSAVVSTSHDYDLSTLQKSSFQGNLFSTVKQGYLVGTVVIVMVLFLARYIWIIHETDKWNRLLTAYLNDRIETKPLTNRQEADFNRAYLDPDLFLFLNFRLWTYKQMCYCPFIHHNVINFHKAVHNV
jgi:hypothetical protein